MPVRIGSGLGRPRYALSLCRKAGGRGRCGHAGFKSGAITLKTWPRHLRQNPAATGISRGSPASAPRQSPPPASPGRPAFASAAPHGPSRERSHSCAPDVRYKATLASPCGTSGAAPAARFRCFSWRNSPARHRIHPHSDAGHRPHTPLRRRGFGGGGSNSFANTAPRTTLLRRALRFAPTWLSLGTCS